MVKKKRGILGPPAYQKRVISGAQPRCHLSLQPNRDCTRAQKTCKLTSELQQQCSVIVGKLLRAATTGTSGGTVKGLCLRPHVSNKRAVYAVVCETLKHVTVLKAILDSTDFLDSHPWVRPTYLVRCPGLLPWQNSRTAIQVSLGAALVLLYDHLLGQGVKGHGKAERAFLAHSGSFLQKQMELLAGHNGAVSISDLLPKESRSVMNSLRPQGQRYIRCNTALTTTADIMTLLHQPPEAWGAQHQQRVEKKDIWCETGMSDVLAIPAGVIVHDHPLVLSGKVVIQGRSSCMPAHALAPKPGWNVLDCCAAPGNKTTHVAAMVGTAGSIMAFDKDKKRCEILKRAVTRCKATNVQVRHQDFLTVDPDAKDCLQINAILLDPSCSGSGTKTTRMDFLLPCGEENSHSGIVCSPDKNEQFPGPTSNNTQRVKSLAAFQSRALQHALKFTNVQRIVYSTCSVYVEENENVVAAVLPEAEAAGFRLVRALPFWHRRGLTSAFPWADNLVRVHPVLDGGDGFFVAVFDREHVCGTPV